jgi:hypothetical protein
MGVVEIVGIVLVTGVTIAVGYVFVRWPSITARSAERQEGRPYTQSERALLLIPLLGGIAGIILLVLVAVNR